MVRVTERARGNPSRAFANLAATDIKARFGDLLSAKAPLSVSMTAGQFVSLYKHCQARQRLDKAFSVAAELVKYTPIPSGLMYLCALRAHLSKDDVASFKAIYSLMLASPHALELNYPQNFSVWEDATKLARKDLDLLETLLEHAKMTSFVNGSQKGVVYIAVSTALLTNLITREDVNRFLAWHARLLANEFVPDDKQLSIVLQAVCRLPKSVEILQELYRSLQRHGLASSFYTSPIPYLCSLKLFEQAQQLYEFLMAQSDPPESLWAVEELLRHHTQVSDTSRTMDFIQKLQNSNTRLSQTSKIMIAKLYGACHDFAWLGRFCQTNYTGKDHQEIDAFWAASLQSALQHGGNILECLKLLQNHGARIGEISLGICIQGATNLRQVQGLVGSMLSRRLTVSARGYAVLIRFVAKSGQLRRAQLLLADTLQGNKLVKVRETDAQYLRRCFLLGLLEGGYHDDMEAVHSEFCLDKRDAADTWNLLVRSRLVCRHMREAFDGLKQMEVLQLDVENATAQEFLFALLRRRSPGHSPDVMHVADRRPYLADIKEAIKVLYKCSQLGGRVQPETWLEILKRFSLYGEFEALEVLTDWLIPQYRGTHQAQGSQQVFKCRDVDKDLPLSKHPLSRLIPEKEMRAMVTRGFKVGKPSEALRLLLKWQSMGVRVDRDAVLKRIKVGLAYSAAQEGATLAAARRLRDDVLHVFRKFS